MILRRLVVARVLPSVGSARARRSLPRGVDAQVTVTDLVFTGGLAGEAYRGNFSAVTVPLVDPTDHAAAAVGQLGAWGKLNFLDTPDGQYLDLTFDGGLRQFAAAGFELRDYAPREWAARLELDYGRAFADVGRLAIRTGYQGRWVEDRPPLPLFLQPGYESFRGLARFEFFPIQGVAFDATLDAERSNYEQLQILSRLDLLDRKSQGIELGAQTGGTGFWSVRFFTAFRWSRYENQATSLPTDAFRRDRTVDIGASWSARGAVAANLGIEGTVNRSNSDRPEYDAVSVRGDLTTLLPMWDLTAGVFTLLTWKTYVHHTPFPRLVPLGRRQTTRPLSTSTSVDRSRRTSTPCCVSAGHARKPTSVRPTTSAWARPSS